MPLCGRLLANAHGFALEQDRKVCALLLAPHHTANAAPTGPFEAGTGPFEAGCDAHASLYYRPAFRC